MNLQLQLSSTISESVCLLIWIFVLLPQPAILPLPCQIQLLIGGLLPNAGPFFSSLVWLFLSKSNYYKSIGILLLSAQRSSCMLNSVALFPFCVLIVSCPTQRLLPRWSSSDSTDLRFGPVLKVIDCSAHCRSITKPLPVIKPVCILQGISLLSDLFFLFYVFNFVTNSLQWITIKGLEQGSLPSSGVA